MKHLGIALFGAALVACHSASQPSSSVTRDPAPDIAAIRAHSEAFDLALTRGDEFRFMNLLADDIIWMVPNQTAIAGRDAVRARIRGLLARSSIDLRSTIEEVRVVGDWAYVRSAYRMRVVPKATGVPTDEVGKSINILDRAGDGSWRLRRHIWNADHPDR